MGIVKGGGGIGNDGKPTQLIDRTHPLAACTQPHAPPPTCCPQERKNVEGSLFLLKRRKEPRFQMMVLNKLSTGEFQGGGR